MRFFSHTANGFLAACAILLAALTACTPSGEPPVETAKSGENAAAPPEATLDVFATSDRQWTGVAVSSEGRVFTNFPLWGESVELSVGEVLDDGSVVAYPSEIWNDWGAEDPPGDRFVCVQSVVVDARDRLWILDPANPRFQGVVLGGPKLVQVDLETDEVVRVLPFDMTVTRADSYLNDVRVDVAHEHAYITDSGVGGLVVVDLATGQARRVLDGHPSTMSEGIVLTIEGKEWRRPDGTAPDVHADGIALPNDNEWVYYQALTGRTMYRVPSEALRDETLSAEDLAARVETVGETGASDGLLAAPGGGVLISAIEHDAVRRALPDGTVETVVSDPRLAWPDSFAAGPDGWIYVTTSQIHRGPDPGEPYRILRFRM